MYVSFSPDLLYHKYMNKIKSAVIGLILLAVFSLAYIIACNFAEPKAYDFMVKHVQTQALGFDTKKQVYGSDDIVLVVVDAKTVERYRWPWKRDKYCKIFEYLNNYAAPKAIMHDAIVSANDFENPDSDRKFYKSISKINNLVAGFLPNVYPWEDERSGQRFDQIFEKKFSIRVQDMTSPNPDLFESILPIPYEYLNSIKYAGSVYMLPGAMNGNLRMIDEICRTHEYIFKYKGGFYPSLAFRTFLLVKNNPEIILKDNFMELPGLGYKIRQDKSIYRMTTPVKYYQLYDSGYSHKYYSAIDLMDSYDNIKAGKKPVLNPKIFKDKIVVVGANVPAGTGLNDNKNTPLRSNHPGVDYQATALDNILHNDFLTVIPDFVNLLITLLGMFLVYGFIRISGLTRSIISTLSIIFIYFSISSVCFYNNIVINVLSPVIMFVLTTIIAYTHKYVLENRTKEKVTFAMGKYMSQDVMKNVMQDIDNLGLGGKKAQVTVLFSDIRGFTSISEKMSAQQVSEFLNEYFSEMEPIITKYNGIINKFIGDAIMAVFGEPIQDENHVQNAVKCGYEMLLRVNKLNKKWERQNKPEIKIGVGVNTGEVFVGNIGSVNRMEYTVIGDTVNLASRLESYNKVYNTKMLISPSVYKEVRKFTDVVKMPDVQIRGKANKMDIYEVIRIRDEQYNPN